MITATQLVEVRKAVVQCLADLEASRTPWILALADEDGIERSVQCVDSFSKRTQRAHDALMTEGFAEVIAIGNLEFGTPSPVSLTFRSVLYGSEIEIVECEEVFPNWHVAAFSLVRDVIGHIAGVIKAQERSISNADSQKRLASIIRDVLNETFYPKDLQSLQIRVFNESVQAVNCLERNGPQNPKSPPEDNNVYVLASELGWESDFSNYKQFKRWVDDLPDDENGVRRRKPSTQRFELHIGDYRKRITERQNKSFEALDALDEPDFEARKRDARDRRK